MSARWLFIGLRRFLQSIITWLDSRAHQDSPRKDRPSIFNREIHVPTPLVAAGAAAALFLILLPEVGLAPKLMVALLGLVSLLVLFFVIYFRYDLPQFVHDDEAVFLTGLCVVLGVIFVQLGQWIPGYSPYAVPVGAIAILVTLLLHVRVAFLISVILSIVTGVLHHFSFDAMLVAFFGCAAAMLAAHKVRHRRDITEAGLHVAWVTMVALYGLGMFHGWETSAILMNLRWGALNGFLCMLISLGLLPVFESFFSRVTKITLLEVGDFNHPLLRRLMVEAPGTYHHTLLVASLAEQAAETIGANSLLCRVGMYYHDIGKLVHPEYFIENQTMRRSAKDKSEHHDRINPSISSLVIMSHVKEGIALARAYRVPEEIIRFIPEHHGTSLIKYFYMRALEQDDEQAPPAEVFRYPGPRPHSKETVIAMLADSTEAASRTLEEPTYDRLKDLVEKIVNGKFIDGQLDSAPITLQDLRSIIDSFTHSLSAIYHVRIEYPELPSEEQPKRQLPKDKENG